MIREVFAGKDTGARRRAVALNAGAALMIGGRADSMGEGVRLAEQLIKSGAAQAKLEALINASQAYSGK